MLAVAACQPTCNPPKATTTASPSTSPSSSPSASSSPVAEASPSPSASAVASPVGAALAISNLPFHSGEVGIQYAPVQVSASGGKPPYQWSITDGTFPPGLSLSAGGTATGTSAQSGKFDFTVHVVDAAGGAANLGTSVLIYAALTTAAYCAGQCAVEAGCTNACGVFGGASGGLAPYQYTVTAGAPPPGMGLSGLTVTGTFQAGPVGQYNLTVVVSDQYGAQGTVTANWYVFPHVSLASGSCLGNFNTGCSGQLPISGGTPNGTPTVTLVSIGPTTQGCWPATPGPTPPAGYTLSAGGGNVTVTIPKGIASGYGAVWTLMLTDQSLCAPGTKCTSQNATATIQLPCS